MLERVIVLGHAKPWALKADNGQELKGVKLSYISSTPATGLDGSKGYLPIQTNLDPMVLNDLKALPGVYDIGYVMKPGKNNKPELVINSVKFVKEVSLDNLFR